ncbi:hypothetical protein FVER53590_12656 [Fusarium verticillioides]|nr:hypothetical protein FVER53590_12656 [Fusarium verticillioides]
MENFTIEEETYSLLTELRGRELVSFALSIQEPVSDYQIELYIFTSLLLVQKFGHPPFAKAAENFSRVWSNKPSNDVHEQSRRAAIHSLAKDRMHELEALWTKLIESRELIMLFYDVYSKEKDLDHLQCAIDATRALLETIPKKYMFWVDIAESFYHLLMEKYIATGEEQDSKRAQKYMDEAVYDMRGHIREDELLFNLAHHTLKGFAERDKPVLLDHAIDLCRDSIRATREDSTQLAHRMSFLGEQLARRSRKTGSEDDLNDAIHVLKENLENDPEPESDHFDFRFILSHCLLQRSQKNGSDLDHEDAIGVMTRLLDLTDNAHSDLPWYIEILAHLLHSRYLKKGDATDLDRSIDLLDRAVNIHPAEAVLRSHLGEWLGKRFTLTGSLPDLDRGISLAKMALESASGNSAYKILLANLLRDRSEATGCDEDLEQAIKLAISCLKSKDNEDEWQSSFHYSSLSVMLHDRYKRIGELGDLNQAIDLAKTATDLQPREGTYLNRLGGFLAERYVRTWETEDVDLATQALETAISLEPRTGSYGAEVQWMNTLSNILLRRYVQTQSKADLDRSMTLAIGTARSSGPDSVHQGAYWHSLGSKILYRARQEGGTIQDVDLATQLLGKALTLIPPGHPRRVDTLLVMAEARIDKYKRTRSEDDIRLMLSDLMECWNCQAAPLHLRMRAVGDAAEARSRENMRESCDLLREAIELIPRLCPRSLPNSDKQSILTSIARLASAAAYYALRSGEKPESALGLLESGRSIITNILMNMRVDTSDLKDKHPDLADRFSSLTDTLDSVANATESYGPMNVLQPEQWESHVKRRREADIEFTKLIDVIRSKPGFESFLLPMTAEDLKAAANPDPIIVINMNVHTSDAFLIESHQIKWLHLPDLTIPETQRRVAELRRSFHSDSYDIRPLLEWLWTVVCSPCLEELGFTGPVSDGNWPRVWWVPTGELCQLPLHAAGIHQRGSTQTVLDRVMSSYAVSVQALRHGRQLRIQPASKERADNQALLVAMRDTPEQISLPSAETEVNALSSLCPSLNLAPTTPKRTERTKKIILDHIRPLKKLFTPGGLAKRSLNCIRCPGFEASEKSAFPSLSLCLFHKL